MEKLNHRWSNRSVMSDEDSEDPLEEPLEDARRVVDHQINLVEGSERELLRIVRLNLLLLGGMVPAVQAVRFLNDGTSQPLAVGLPWFLLAVALIVTSILFANLAYRAKLLYGGFEDSPNLGVTQLTGRPLGEPTESDVPRKEEFDADFTENAEKMRARLLWDYAKGIRHNNRETSHRYAIIRYVTIMMTIGIVCFIVGALAMLSKNSGTVLNGVNHSAPLVVVGGISLLFFLLTTRAFLKFACHQWDDDKRFKTEDYGPHHELIWWWRLLCSTPVRRVVDLPGNVLDSVLGRARRRKGDNEGKSGRGGE